MKRRDRSHNEICRRTLEDVKWDLIPFHTTFFVTSHGSGQKRCLDGILVDLSEGPDQEINRALNLKPLKPLQPETLGLLVTSQNVQF